MPRPHSRRRAAPRPRLRRELRVRAHLRSQSPQQALQPRWLLERSSRPQQSRQAPRGTGFSRLSGLGGCLVDSGRGGGGHLRCTRLCRSFSSLGGCRCCRSFGGRGGYRCRWRLAFLRGGRGVLITLLLVRRRRRQRPWPLSAPLHALAAVGVPRSRARLAPQARSRLAQTRRRFLPLH